MIHDVMVGFVVVILGFVLGWGFWCLPRWASATITSSTISIKMTG